MPDLFASQPLQKPLAERMRPRRVDEVVGQPRLESLDAAAIDLTLGSALKYSEDQEVIRAAGLDELVRSGG